VLRSAAKSDRPFAQGAMETFDASRGEVGRNSSSADTVGEDTHSKIADGEEAVVALHPGMVASEIKLPLLVVVSGVGEEVNRVETSMRLESSGMQVQLANRIVFQNVAVDKLVVDVITCGLKRKVKTSVDKKAIVSMLFFPSGKKTEFMVRLVTKPRTWARKKDLLTQLAQNLERDLKHFERTGLMPATALPTWNSYRDVYREFGIFTRRFEGAIKKNHETLDMARQKRRRTVSGEKESTPAVELAPLPPTLH